MTMKNPEPVRAFYWLPLKIIPVLLLMSGILMLAINEMTRPIEKKPWWYYDSQLGWDMDHAVAPAGYDEVSQYLIDAYGSTYVPWKPDQMWSFSADSDMRFQRIQGNMFLFRSVDGQLGVFAGGGQVHLPLKEDPVDSDKKLIDCLNDKDDGKLLSPNPKAGPSITEMMEASGVIMEKPR